MLFQHFDRRSLALLDAPSPTPVNQKVSQPQEPSASNQNMEKVAGKGREGADLEARGRLA
jgi:hypothetical protein